MFRDKKASFTQCLESLIAFCNSHLMLKTKNRLAVLGCHAKRTIFLYPGPDDEAQNIRQQDGQYELFTQVEKCIKDNLQTLIKQETESIKRTKNVGVCDSLIAGAIAMALCYIKRCVKSVSCLFDDCVFFQTGA